MKASYIKIRKNSSITGDKNCTKRSVIRMINNCCGALVKVELDHSADSGSNLVLALHSYRLSW